MIHSKIKKIFFIFFAVFIFCAISIHIVSAVPSSDFTQPTLPSSDPNEYNPDAEHQQPLGGTLFNTNGPDFVGPPETYTTVSTQTNVSQPVTNTTANTFNTTPTTAMSTPATIAPVAAVGNFIVYGGHVLMRWPCLNGTVIMIGPPKPAVVMVTGATMRKLYYMEKIPGHIDLGNATVGGSCVVFNYLGIKISIPVPATAYYIGSNLIAGGAPAEENTNAPQAEGVDTATNPTIGYQGGADSGYTVDQNGTVYYNGAATNYTLNANNQVVDSNGQIVSDSLTRTTYFSHNEPINDSNTRNFHSAYGDMPLRYSDNPNIVGSAGTYSGIYPAGTVFKINEADGYHYYTAVDNNAEAGSPNTINGAIDIFKRGPDGVEPGKNLPEYQSVTVVFKPSSTNYFANLTSAQRQQFYNIDYVKSLDKTH